MKKPLGPDQIHLEFRDAQIVGDSGDSVTLAMPGTRIDLGALHDAIETISGITDVQRSVLHVAIENVGMELLLLSLKGHVRLH